MPYLIVQCTNKLSRKNELELIKKGFAIFQQNIGSFMRSNIVLLLVSMNECCRDVQYTE